MAKKSESKNAKKQTAKPKSTGLDDALRKIDEEDLWETIIPASEAWEKVDDEIINACTPFDKNEVFDEKEESIHNRGKLGQRVMGIKGRNIASAEEWEQLFMNSFDKEGSFFAAPIASTLREFAVRLAMSSPKKTFTKDLWDHGKLSLNLVTNPWIGAYQMFGAKWTKHSTFKEYLEDTDEDVEMFDSSIAEQQDAKPNNPAFLSLPIKSPERNAPMFNVFSRKFITFVKFKTPMFEGDERRQRELEFIEAMKEMLEMVWEADPTALLIPWEIDSKAKPIKKTTVKFPNTSDGWRIYMDRVFLKKDSRCWPRLRFAHNLHSSFMEERDFTDAFKVNDCYLSKEAIQSYESSKIGWFLGSHVNAFNTETMKLALSQQHGLKNIPIHLKVEYIRLDVKVPGNVKAVHIYSERSKAYACRAALIKIYGKENTDNLPLGKNMRFIPDVTDTRFVTTAKTKLRVRKCESKQKRFLNSSSTARNFTILGLDYFHPKIGLTLRQAIMGIRSVGDEERNLFMAVDKMVTSNTVIFAFHNELTSEANTVIAALPVVLEAKYGDHIWKWFHDEARDTSAGYEWDEKEGIIEKKDDINMEWEGPEDNEEDDDSEVVVEGAGRFKIDTNKRGRSELNDGGSTVGSWKSTLRKRKFGDSWSSASSITNSTANDLERFKHLLQNDPTYRAEVLNLTGKIHKKNTGPAQANMSNTSTTGDSSGASS